MYTRATTLGILAALALTLNERPSFTLESTGAVGLTAAGHEARYGVVPGSVRGRPILSISLGAATEAGSVHLYRLGDRLPAPGRYRIQSSWEEGNDTTAFHASFMPGTAERPLGWFHGESGWVTIAKAAAGRMEGTFEVRARGFAAADPDDEDRWVTVRGSFGAAGDSTVARIAPAW